MSSFGSDRRRSCFQRLLLGSRRLVRLAELRVSLSVALLFLCGGCLVGPDFSSPSALVADKWLEANNPSVDTRNQEYRDWWKVFHDPVLNRLIEIAYNQNLTLVSAGTQVLSHGVDPNILSAKGFGETRPIAPNDTPQGRAQNRRIEIVLEGLGA